ncbi:MAG: GNAT family N-acetyltransferase [Actinomycetota bacterium]
MIREIRITDYLEIYNLCCQHGYPFTKKQIKANIETIINEGRDKIFVEVNSNDKVIGYIHLSPYKLLYFEPLVNIMGIVVDEKYRRQGIGKRLIQSAKEWTKLNNFKGIRVISGNQRKTAHIFYESVGFKFEELQKNFKMFF